MTEISVSLASRLWMACKPTVKFGVLGLMLSRIHCLLRRGGSIFGQCPRRR